MENKRNEARDIAEEGLDKIVEGDEEEGQKLIDRAKKLDPKAVEAARRRGLDVRLGSVEQQAYASDTFDAVVMSHVIEHVPDPRGLIRECRRILKQGGHFVCITPNCASWCSGIFKSVGATARRITLRTCSGCC